MCVPLKSQTPSVRKAWLQVYWSRGALIPFIVHHVNIIDRNCWLLLSKQTADRWLRWNVWQNNIKSTSKYWFGIMHCWNGVETGHNQLWPVYMNSYRSGSGKFHFQIWRRQQYWWDFTSSIIVFSKLFLRQKHMKLDFHIWWFLGVSLCKFVCPMCTAKLR